MRSAAAFVLIAAAGCITPGSEVAEPAHAPPADAVAVGAAGPEPEASVRDALAASLVYLEAEGTAWMRGETELNRGNGCVSCHVVGMGLWSHRAASERGLLVAGESFAQLAAEAMEFIGRPRIGRPVSWSQMLQSRDRRSAAGPEWQAMVEGTVASQERAGHWRARGQFPDQRRPVAESDAVATMWSLLAVDSPELESSDWAAATSGAIEWLERADDGTSSEWLAMRLLTGLGRDTAAESDRLRDRLIGEQRDDGGWSWLLRASPGGEGDLSNAYSTGVALYALVGSGTSPTDAAVLRGVDYMLETQETDGRWQVPSRLISAAPSAPKDTIYDYWGTAWAVIGLSELLDEATG